MAAKPNKVELKPREIFSAPRLGPTVLSSIISIGAANAPARSNSEISLASEIDIFPVICTRPLGISSCITGAVITSF